MKNYYMVRTRVDVDDFVKKSKVAVGWSDIDFTKYINRQDELLEDAQKRYYSSDDVSPQLRGRKRGEIKRFISIQKGDVIVVPSYRSFYLGYATGDFIYDESCRDDDLSNQLSVDFKKDENGEPIAFAQEGKNTALTTKLGVRGFTVLDIKGKELIHTIEDLLNSKEDLSDADKIIKSEKQGLEEFKSQLRDVLSNYKKTSLRSGGIGFEELINSLMECAGYTAKILSKRSVGSGIADADILAIKESKLSDEFTTACYIQAKHYWGESTDGIDQIIAFKNQLTNSFKKNNDLDKENDDLDNIPVLPENTRYYLISSGDFSQKVRDKAGRTNITLIDGERLAEILFDKIDELPEIRYQLGFIKKYEHYTNQ